MKDFHDKIVRDFSRCFAKNNTEIELLPMNGMILLWHLLLTGMYFTALSVIVRCSKVQTARGVMHAARPHLDVDVEVCAVGCSLNPALD